MSKKNKKRAAKVAAALQTAPKAEKAEKAVKAEKTVVNKGMLIDAVADKLEGAAPKKDVKAVIDAVLATVVEKVEEGGEVRLVGFGTFKQSHRAARTGRNPQTGEAIEIKASNAFAFKSSIKF